MLIVINYNLASYNSPRGVLDWPFSPKFSMFRFVTMVTIATSISGIHIYSSSSKIVQGYHGRDRMVVRFTTTCAISNYHH
jgi:hypothetical protein